MEQPFKKKKGNGVGGAVVRGREHAEAFVKEEVADDPPISLISPGSHLPGEPKNAVIICSQRLKKR